MQKVSLGITQSGTPGLFTKRMLAMTLSVAEYRKALTDHEYAQQLAAKWRFEYVDTDAQTFEEVRP